MYVSEQILLFLSREGTQSRAAIEAETGYKRTKVVEELKLLMKTGQVKQVGEGRAIKYKLA